MSYLLGYYGGKIGPIGAWVAAQLPPHQLYVEPFGGMAGVLLQKPRAAVEVYNDRAGELVNLFRVVREQPDALRAALALTPYSRDEYRACCKGKDDAGLSDVERARRTYVILAQGRDGSPTGTSGFSFGGAAHKSSVADTFVRGQQRIPWVCERLRTVLLENQDWQPICRQHEGASTLIYFDPPYVRRTRTANGDKYLYEFSDTQHQELLTWCLSSRSKIAVSGYESDLYAPLVAAGWECRRLPVVAHSSGSKIKKGAPRASRTECLWLNPAARATPTLFCTPTPTTA